MPQQPTTQSFGTVTHNGVALTLTQVAYPDRCINGDTDFTPGEDLYAARATDAAGNVYLVRWEITGDVDGDDASNVCNWDSPTSAVLIECTE